ncbi:para-aminobenzoate synthetase component 1 [Amycolatopsis endophytica]|uniref:Para-aminobenzoate synthetase component 1 n=1 Tax=Amycolatopsis endophytica TaxID=860233 RepID=A0A853B3S4_9PSEU|nr:aminodeoxychorismate synthase component I [Amycolatopsis endophytica]NYI89411.1 para-aminobenzoate synthetase component 1 [Amycolatopsis endophytica]
MRVTRTRLGRGRTPDEVLLLLDERARFRGIGTAAGLSGDWFGSRAVLAPEVQLRPVSDPFEVPDLQPRVERVDGAVGGGWIGYLSYDLADPSGRRADLPEAVWGWADHVLRLDADGWWWFESLDSDVTAAEFERLLSLPAPAPSWRAGPLDRPLPAEHGHAVKTCVHAIEAGELYQANICSRFAGSFAGSPAALFAAGVRGLQPRRAAFLTGDWGSVVSFSPELFLARHGDHVRSTPVKGTLPRRGPADDALRQRLRESAKDVAENVMITDLVRNDLGRVCATGSVRVPELLRVRPAPGVWHLESTVEGRLTGSDADLLAAAFPPGSVTGAPKIRALDLIAELEPRPRGVYTGAIGMASPVAGLELNVAIRTFELHGDRIALGVGGGITADSDPDAEWQECLHKAAPLETLLTG